EDGPSIFGQVRESRLEHARQPQQRHKQPRSRTSLLHYDTNSVAARELDAGISLGAKPFDIALERPELLPHAREHFSYEAEAKQRHAGDDEDHDQVQEWAKAYMGWPKTEVERDPTHDQPQQEEHR